MTRLPFIITAFSLLIIASCRKRDDATAAVTPQIPDFGQGTGRCRLTGVTEHDTTSRITGNMYLTYDSTARLKTVLELNTRHSNFFGSSIYTYSGDTMFARHSGYTLFDTILFNSDRQIARIGGLGNSFGWAFRYDSLKQLSEIYPVNGVSSDDIYLWQNGDMIRDSLLNTGSIRNTDYAYLSNQKAQIASPSSLVFFTSYGAPLYRSAHLESIIYSGIGGVYTQKIGYAFDADGKIIADTISAAPSTPAYFNTFEYECR